MQISIKFLNQLLYVKKSFAGMQISIELTLRVLHKIVQQLDNYIKF